jgi:hypothetical protein
VRITIIIKPNHIALRQLAFGPFLSSSIAFLDTPIGARRLRRFTDSPLTS